MYKQSGQSVCFSHYAALESPQGRCAIVLSVVCDPFGGSAVDTSTALRRTFAPNMAPAMTVPAATRYRPKLQLRDHWQFDVAVHERFLLPTMPRDRPAASVSDFVTSRRGIPVRAQNCITRHPPTPASSEAHPWSPTARSGTGLLPISERQEGLFRVPGTT